MPDAATDKVIFAWCFSHGRLHIYTTEADPWCTAHWTPLTGPSRDDAEKDKQDRYGDAVFLHHLPPQQQIEIIDQHREHRAQEERPGR